MNYKSSDTSNGYVKWLNIGVREVLLEETIKSGTFPQLNDLRSKNGRKSDCNCSF
jgi:hypothetical protein